MHALYEFNVTTHAIHLMFILGKMEMFEYSYPVYNAHIPNSSLFLSYRTALLHGPYCLLKKYCIFIYPLWIL